ncbi:hypothetical protein FHL15_005237 [Xylaria flabelliformis]|uniref:Uncharacterized protein n=1 Tax=Xylaria flabelliformis TaxID=2512241 RepID=A0A553I0Z5_9PEZI|nr:hypothetical protein FHL15_005237 [Xylaria flabelliformis]
MKPTTSLFAAILASTPIVSAGPAAYGICQAGCAAVVTACYAAAGFTWGATAGISAPATIVACNTASGTCQAACPFFFSAQEGVWKLLKPSEVTLEMAIADSDCSSGLPLSLRHHEANVLMCVRPYQSVACQN